MLLELAKYLCNKYQLRMLPDEVAEYYTLTYAGYWFFYMCKTEDYCMVRDINNEMYDGYSIIKYSDPEMLEKIDKLIKKYINMFEE